MNDDELDRLVATSAPITEGQVASLDLRDAEIELMEEIMATTTREVRLVGEPRPPRPRLTGFRIAAAAAAVVAVVAAGVAISGQDDSGSVDTGSTTPAGTELPYLVPDHLPAGLSLAGAHALGQPTWYDNTVVYGRPAAEGLPDVDLTVSWVNANDEATHGSSTAYSPVTVRGHDGYACSGAACAGVGPGVQAAVEWTERAGKFFYLASPTLTVEQLVAIADGLVIGGHVDDEDGPRGAVFVIGLDEVNLGTVPDDLPAPLEELGRRDYRMDLSRPTIPIDVDGSLSPAEMGPPDMVHLDYRLDDPTGALTVEVEPGEDFDLADTVAIGAGEPIADVRGHPAWSITLPPGPGFDVERRSIVWQEAPGVVVAIETFGTDYDVDVLRDVAESLRPATDAEWQDMVDTAEAWERQHMEDQSGG
jgi:hypothetical protein